MKNGFFRSKTGKVIFAALLILALSACGGKDKFKINMERVLNTEIDIFRKTLSDYDSQGESYSDDVILLRKAIMRRTFFYEAEAAGRKTDSEGKKILVYKDANGNSIYTDNNRYIGNKNWSREDVLDVIYEIACMEGNAARSDMEGFEEYPPSEFSNLKGTGYYFEAVEWAASIGIIQGDEYGRFYPGFSSTLEEFFSYLYNYAKLYGDPKPEGDLSLLGEDAEVSEEVQDAVSWALGERMWPLTREPEEYFAPDFPVTDSNVSFILMRYFANFRGI